MEVCNVEGIKLEEDQKIKDELAFYAQKREVKREADSEKENTESKTEVKQEEKTSPLLKSNPFVKRFSKFPRTQTSTDVIVKSRYFSSNNSEQNEDANPDSERNSIEINDIKSESPRTTENDLCDNSDTAKANDIIDISENDEETISPTTNTQGFQTSSQNCGVLDPPQSQEVSLSLIKLLIFEVCD